MREIETPEEFAKSYKWNIKNNVKKIESFGEEMARMRQDIKEKMEKIKSIKPTIDVNEVTKKKTQSKKRSPSPSKSVSSVSVESVKPPTKRKINALIRKIPDDTYNEKTIYKIVDKIRSGDYTSITDFPKPSKTGPKSKIVFEYGKIGN